MSTNISDPIRYAISKVIQRIPVTVLDMAFKSYKSKCFINTSTSLYNTLESDIESIIIRQIVAPDCNIGGGKLKECVLLDEMIEHTSYRDSDLHIRKAQNTVYRIPPAERENREITKVVKLRHQGMGGVDTPYNLMAGISSLKDQLRNVLGSQSFNDAYAAPNVKVIPPDMIQIESPVINHIYWVLTFMVAYPYTFNNINQSSYIPFADAVINATKYFIYNTLVIEIDAAATRGGVTIGSLRDIIFEYKDAEEKYTAAIDTFTATERYDPRTFNELAKMCL
jgi:uncharacterized membrane protein